MIRNTVLLWCPSIVTLENVETFILFGFPTVIPKAPFQFLRPLYYRPWDGPALLLSSVDWCDGVGFRVQGLGFGVQRQGFRTYRVADLTERSHIYCALRQKSASRPILLSGQNTPSVQDLLTAA